MMPFIKSLSKRWLMLITILAILLVSFGLNFSSSTNINKAESDDIKVFTPDWGVGASLVAMGSPPIAFGSKKNYEVRVHTPKLPETVKDIGLKYEPNLELLAQLQPDIIMYTYFYRSQERIYDPQIPIEEIDFGIENSNSNQILKWSTYAASARKMGKLLDRQAQTEHYIADSQQRIFNAGNSVRSHIGNKKLLVIELVDAREIRLYAKNSLVSLAIEMMGLETMPIQGKDVWGTVPVPTHKLHRIFKQSENVCLIIVEHTPILTKYEIAKSPIWQRSPFLKPDACVYHIDPVWTNGGIEVMVTFANNLEKAVLDKENNNSDYVSLKQLAARK